MHLAAIDPSASVLPLVREVGFDSVTHYVLLPDWKGPFVQDYRASAALRAAQWPRFAEVSGLPYMPSVSPGWDASPRGVDFGDARPDKYPWSPVVTGEHPELFAAALQRAHSFRSRVAVDDALVLVASLNEVPPPHQGPEQILDEVKDGSKIGRATDPAPSIRLQAVIALQRIGPAAHEALPALRKAAQDPDPRFREQVGEAIKAIDVPGPKKE